MVLPVAGRRAVGVAAATSRRWRGPMLRVPVTRFRCGRSGAAEVRSCCGVSGRSAVVKVRGAEGCPSPQPPRPSVAGLPRPANISSIRNLPSLARLPSDRRDRTGDALAQGSIAARQLGPVEDHIIMLVCA